MFPVHVVCMARGVNGQVWVFLQIRPPVLYHYVFPYSKKSRLSFLRFRLYEIDCSPPGSIWGRIISSSALRLLIIFTEEGTSGNKGAVADTVGEDLWNPSPSGTGRVFRCGLYERRLYRGKARGADGLQVSPPGPVRRCA